MSNPRRNCPRRRRRHRRPHLQSKSLRTHRGRPIGCRCSRSPRRGCHRIRTRRPRQAHCTRRMCRMPRRNCRRRRRRRRRPHLQSKPLRTHRGRQLGCRCNRSPRRGCHRIRIRRRRRAHCTRRRCRRATPRSTHAVVISKAPTQSTSSHAEGVKCQSQSQKPVVVQDCSIRRRMRPRHRSCPRRHKWASARQVEGVWLPSQSQSAAGRSVQPHS